MHSWLPTSLPSPPQLDVQVAQPHLRRLFEPLVAVDGRAVLTVGDDALVARRVDDAMITAVEATSIRASVSSTKLHQGASRSTL